jgi:hypothetical protein
VPFLVAFYEPEVLGQATRDLVSDQFPELGFVSLLPGETITPLTSRSRAERRSQD